MTNPGLALATVGPDGLSGAADGSVIQCPSHHSEGVPTPRPATGHRQTTTASGRSTIEFADGTDPTPV
jgi:hypothetical protein